MRTSNAFYTRHKYFEKLPPSNFEVPVIWNASEYLSQEEIYWREQEKGKLKRIANNDFKTFFGKATTGLKKGNFIPNYVTATPSEPPMLHKFRVENWDKWIINN